MFPKYHAAVFVHGCFWHGHDCPLFKRPATDAEFWERKEERNKANDSAALNALRGRRWRVMVVWECALCGRARRPIEEVLDTVIAWLDSQISLAGVWGDWPEQRSDGNVGMRVMAE